MIRRIFLAAFALLAALAANAQSLTNAQLTTLKACINAVPEWAALPLTSASAATIATGLNATASPAWIVWRKTVPTLEIGLVVNYVAVAAMTTANLDRVTVFYTLNPSSFDPSRADIRTYLSDTFSGALGGQGQATRDALDAMYRRSATSGEKCLSTGTGTTVAPAVMGYEGAISTDAVQQARELP